MDKLIYLLDQAESACDQYRRRLEDLGILLAERTTKLKSLRAENQTMRRENFRLREKKKVKEQPKESPNSRVVCFPEKKGT